MTNEVVLITGASSGIGRELAQLFAADRNSLVLVARRGEKLQQLADELRREHGVEARVLVADLSETAAPQAIFDQLTAAGVAVDVLVNNAGFGAAGPLVDLPVSQVRDMLAVDVVAVTQLTRLFVPGMVQRGRGGVLNVGSTAGFQPGPLMSVYYAAKAYVLSISEALAEELSGTGVVVSCLCPGPTHTGFAATAGLEGRLLFKLGAMDAATVARIGYRGFRRGKRVVVPGLKNKFAALTVRLMPRRLVCKMVKRLNS